MVTVLICLGIFLYFKMYYAVLAIILYEIITTAVYWPYAKRKNKERKEKMDAFKEDYRELRVEYSVMSRAIMLGKERGQIKEGDVANIPDKYLNKEYPSHIEVW